MMATIPSYLIVNSVEMYDDTRWSFSSNYNSATHRINFNGEVATLSSDKTTRTVEIFNERITLNLRRPPHGAF